MLNLFLKLVATLDLITVVFVAIYRRPLHRADHLVYTLSCTAPFVNSPSFIALEIDHIQCVFFLYWQIVKVIVLWLHLFAFLCFIFT